MRRSVYPRQVGNGKIKQAEADRRLAIQQAIIDSLREMAQHEALI